nr:agamous-like MADS-box protein AGL61 [Ipomoea trifida]
MDAILTKYFSANPTAQPNTAEQNFRAHCEVVMQILSSQITYLEMKIEEVMKVNQTLRETEKVMPPISELPLSELQSMKHNMEMLRSHVVQKLMRKFMLKLGLLKWPVVARLAIRNLEQMTIFFNGTLVLSLSEPRNAISRENHEASVTSPNPSSVKQLQKWPTPPLPNSSGSSRKHRFPKENVPPPDPYTSPSAATKHKSSLSPRPPNLKHKTPTGSETAVSGSSGSGVKQKLAATEAEIAELRQKLEVSKRSIALKLNSVLTRYGLMLFFREKMLNWLATRDNEQEAEKEVLSVSAERDKALQDLKDSLAYHERELSERDTALSSTDVGKKLTVGSATIVKKVSLELGGNAPCIIFDDTDLDVAVRGIVS